MKKKERKEDRGVGKKLTLIRIASNIHKVSNE